jgi:hypothetical protein
MGREKGVGELWPVGKPEMRRHSFPAKFEETCHKKWLPSIVRIEIPSVSPAMECGQSGRLQTIHEVMNASVFQWLTLIDTACWIFCFFWMHRISTRQDAVLSALRDQAARIEKLAKMEHELVKDIHPKVASIEDDMSEVAGAMRSDRG